MGTLGDSFPSSFRTEFSQERGISPGDVLRLHFPFENKPKFKFMVVACCEPLLVLLINSDIHPFISNKADLLECQVDLPKLDHDFLEWNSFVNCIDAHSAFSLDDVKTKIAADYGSVLKGRIADYCLREIYTAVEKSPVMPRRQKKMILEALKEFQ